MQPWEIVFVIVGLTVAGAIFYLLNRIKEM